MSERLAQPGDSYQIEIKGSSYQGITEEGGQHRDPKGGWLCLAHSALGVFINLRAALIHGESEDIQEHVLAYWCTLHLRPEC